MPWKLLAPSAGPSCCRVPGTPGGHPGGLTAGRHARRRACTRSTRRPGSSPTRPTWPAGSTMPGRRDRRDQDVAFGGGSPATVATVQAVARPGAATARPPSPPATVIGRPAPAPVGLGHGDRSAPPPTSSAATTAPTPTPEVLATTDGTPSPRWPRCRCRCATRRWRPPAGLLYVFGGQAITGAGAGQPGQRHPGGEPGRHTASVVGHLPQARCRPLPPYLGDAGLRGRRRELGAPNVDDRRGDDPAGPASAGANPGSGATSAKATRGDHPGRRRHHGHLLASARARAPARARRARAAGPAASQHRAPPARRPSGRSTPRRTRCSRPGACKSRSRIRAWPCSGRRPGSSAASPTARRCRPCR